MRASFVNAPLVLLLWSCSGPGDRAVSDPILPPARSNLSPPLAGPVTDWDPGRYEETGKTFTHLHSPDGAICLTKGPGGSFSHHRGAFLGFKVKSGGKTQDFWHCHRGESVRHERFLSDAEVHDAGASAFVVAEHGSQRIQLYGVENTWRDDGSEVWLREVRRVRAAAWEGRAVYEFAITLTAERDLQLRGDPHHAGFQFRAAQEVHDDQQKTVTYYRAEGAETKGNDVWTGTDWVGLQLEVGERPFYVLHLDHPDNPRPARYSTRAYGRFGSSFHRDLAKGESLELIYRVVVLDGVAEDGARTALGERSRFLGGKDKGE